MMMIKTNIVRADGISRGAGQSVAGHLAYCTGRAYRDSYYGKKAYGEKRADLVFDELLLPSQAPAALREYQAFLDAWNASEKHPRALMAHKYILALPNELDAAEWIGLARSYAQEMFVSRGFPVFYAIHRGLASEHPKPESIQAGGTREDNPHVHLLAAFRQVGENGFLDTKYAGRTTYGKDFLRQVRQNWCACVNRSYERQGVDVRFVEGAYRNGLMAGLPTKHIGPYAMRLEAAGIKTEAGDRYRSILSQNRVRKQECDHEFLLVDSQDKEHEYCADREE